MLHALACARTSCATARGPAPADASAVLHHRRQDASPRRQARRIWQGAAIIALARTPARTPARAPARSRRLGASRLDLRLGHRVRVFSLNFARERSQANNSTVRVGGDDGVRASPRVACRGCSPARTQPLTAAAGP